MFLFDGLCIEEQRYYRNIGFPLGPSFQDKRLKICQLVL
jgi:hypothetical protein